MALTLATVPRQVVEFVHSLTHSHASSYPLCASLHFAGPRQTGLLLVCFTRPMTTPRYGPKSRLACLTMGALTWGLGSLGLNLVGHGKAGLYDTCTVLRMEQLNKLVRWEYYRQISFRW